MRRLALITMLALAGCEHLDGYEVAGVVAAGLGGAAGGLAAHSLASEPAPVVVQVETEPDGGAVVDWPDAGAGECSAVADRVCCTPGAIRRLAHRDGG